MKSIFKVTKYQLLSFKTQTWICFSVILLNIFVSLFIFNVLVTDKNAATGSGGSSDVIAIIWMFTLGISFFKPSFKFLLSNGVSRKRFLFANIYSFAIIAAVWSIVVTFLVIMGRTYTRISVIYELTYKNLNWLSLATWLFSVFFMFAIIGWFINMLYYRSSTRLKLLISFILFALAPFLLLFSALTNGLLSEIIYEAFIKSMGLGSSTPNSYIATLSMLVWTAVFCGFNFLLIRKAQIKD